MTLAEKQIYCLEEYDSYSRTDSSTYSDQKTIHIKDIMNSLKFDSFSFQINSWPPNWALYIIKSVTCKIILFENLPLTLYLV